MRAYDLRESYLLTVKWTNVMNRAMYWYAMFLIHGYFNLIQTCNTILIYNIFYFTKYLVWTHNKLINISLVFKLVELYKIIRIEFRQFRKEKSLIQLQFFLLHGFVLGST